MASLGLHLRLHRAVRCGRTIFCSPYLSKKKINQEAETSRMIKMKKNPQHYNYMLQLKYALSNIQKSYQEELKYKRELMSLSSDPPLTPSDLKQKIETKLQDMEMTRSGRLGGKHTLKQGLKKSFYQKCREDRQERSRKKRQAAMASFLQKFESDIVTLENLDEKINIIMSKETSFDFAINYKGNIIQEFTWNPTYFKQQLAPGPFSYLLAGAKPPAAMYNPKYYEQCLAHLQSSESTGEPKDMSMNPQNVGAQQTRSIENREVPMDLHHKKVFHVRDLKVKVMPVKRSFFSRNVIIS